MKTIKFFIYTVLVAFLSFASCSTDGEDGMDGAQGIAGPAGQDGADGQDGNANVIASGWIDIDFGEEATYTFATVSAPEITSETISNSAILVYAQITGIDDVVIGIPYSLDSLSSNFILIGDTDTLDLGVTNSILIEVESNFSQDFDDTIDLIRYVIIPPVDAGRSQTMTVEETKRYYVSLGLDLTDYDAVASYFELDK